MHLVSVSNLRVTSTWQLTSDDGYLVLDIIEFTVHDSKTRHCEVYSAGEEALIFMKKLFKLGIAKEKGRRPVTGMFCGWYWVVVFRVP